MNPKKEPARIVDLIIAICIGLLLIGTIFRIQHWPFGAEIKYLNMVSLGVIIVFIGLRYYQNAQRNYSNLIGTLIILLIISIQFNKMILFPKMTGFVGLLLLLLTVWILMNSIAVLRKKGPIQMTTAKIIIITGLSCLIGEVIFKSNHLPMGSILSVSGLFITMVGLILNYTRQKNDNHNIKKTMRNTFLIILICSTTFGSYTQTPESVDFAIDNIAAVNKIVLTGNNGAVFTLIKDTGSWSDLNGNCVIEKHVNLILDVFEDIECKGPLPENTARYYSNRDSITQITVAIYQNDEWVKTWYIGPNSYNGNGQIMFLKSGKSDGETPFLTGMRGFVGTIKPRFFTDPKKWKCTTIFDNPAEKITSVEVTNFENHDESFRVEITQNDFQVYKDSVRLSQADSAAVYRYISYFEKVHFESYDNALTRVQIDSLKTTEPFLKLVLKNRSGADKTLLCYRKTNKRSDTLLDEERFWCILTPDDELVICQYFVFNPILKSDFYFPLSNTPEK